MAAESRLDDQRQLLERQQAQIDGLREEGKALCQCLVSTGLVTREAILAQLHRLRFEKVHQEHPLRSETSLIHALGPQELALAVARSAGSSAVAALRSASRVVSKAVAGSFPCYDMLRTPNVFVCGGYDGVRCLRLVDRFDPATTTWRPLPPMCVRREAAAAAVIDGQLIVCGGFDGTRRLNVAERFDPAVGTWQPLPPMSSRRVGASAGALGGALYVCGGFDGSRYLSSVECFHPKLEAWEPALPMSVAREGAVAAVLGNYLYVCGGNDGSQTLSVAERFPAPAPSNRRGAEELSTPSAGAMFTVTSGRQGGEWESLPNMSARRDGAVGAVLRGKIYVCGGFDGQQSLSLRSTERFDPATNSWRCLPPMLSRRAGAAAAVVAGQLYVCGGYDGAQNLAECERLDPAVGMWELLPAMRCRRGYAAGAAS
mmetsp:Transcript_45140/g.81524  ORF Transcript_45140/g.81524 Transcript_45140/m.81524 type:complete len:429 (-) Transcript_45140:102-1388(-)